MTRKVPPFSPRVSAAANQVFSKTDVSLRQLAERIRKVAPFVPSKTLND